MKRISQVKIVEVGPRDGLQNESQFVPTAIKKQLIELLSKTGLSVIEATSFVSPHKIPNLADHTELYTTLHKTRGISYPVLISNLQGMNNALSAQVKDIALFTAVSESFCKRNINCSIEESLTRFKAIIEIARSRQISIRGYISCVFGCPYEGRMDTSKTIQLTQRLLEMGCDEISLGDTIGIAGPGDTQNVLDALLQEIPKEKVALHFHDTYGQALANIYTAYGYGIRIFDSSVSGLGGCPYAKGATGNVATEDVIYMFNSLNIHTGVDLNLLVKAGEFINSVLKRKSQSKTAIALLAKQKGSHHV